MERGDAAVRRGRDVTVKTKEVVGGDLICVCVVHQQIKRIPELRNYKAMTYCAAPDQHNKSTIYCAFVRLFCGIHPVKITGQGYFYIHYT